METAQGDPKTLAWKAGGTPTQAKGAGSPAARRSWRRLSLALRGRWPCRHLVSSPAKLILGFLASTREHVCVAFSHQVCDR